jgi:hypothetical protein
LEKKSYFVLKMTREVGLQQGLSILRNASPMIITKKFLTSRILTTQTTRHPLIPTASIRIRGLLGRIGISTMIITLAEVLTVGEDVVTEEVAATLHAVGAGVVAAAMEAQTLTTSH